MKSSFEIHIDKLLHNLDDHEKKLAENLRKKYSEYFSKISEFLYENLNSLEKERLVLWFIKRWGKISKNCETEILAYNEDIKRIKSYDYQKIKLNNNEYHLVDLSHQGYKGKLLTYKFNILIHDFYYNQYQNKDFKISPNSVVIDAGAFVGDTALLFQELTNYSCEIHSFELLDESLDLLKFNIKENNIESSITVNKLALTDSSDDYIYIKSPDLKGGTNIFGNPKSDIKVKTITIDDYVKIKKLKTIDFIKMDIEGAERLALKGAENTIREFKPKIAVCLYHFWDDLIIIPEIIKKINKNYKFSFKWVELNNGWEAVLLASLD